MGILRGMGILPWNGHLAWKRCSAVLGVSPMSDCIKTLASCQFPAYFRAGRMPTLLLFIPKFSNA
ncbi:MAG: hypothetical protein F6K55_00730 [Moorea sp. SIO4A3]|nr:hypothetical protein [Moorena sp. SIO4A3]